MRKSRLERMLHSRTLVLGKVPPSLHHEIATALVEAFGRKALAPLAEQLQADEAPSNERHAKKPKRR